jgi:uncharacterized protein YecE (DUF72 family)
MTGSSGTARPRIFIGIGGWKYKPWRGSFYPEGVPQVRELEYASSRLTSIEINSTFYGSQKPATFDKWRAGTPKDFVFAVKAPRSVTHRRVLAEAGDSIERFLVSLLPLKEKLGPVNWQLGPARTFDARDIEAFLELLPAKVAGHPIRHAIEVRHASFNTPEFTDLARKYNVAVVLAGDSQYPQINAVTSSFFYARLMGTTSRTANGYPGPDLDVWAKRVKEWSAGCRDVFVYVISGHKAHNPAAAMSLIERVAGLENTAST